MQGRSATSSAEGMDDAALVERVRRGDASAYDTLVRRHEALCFRTAYGITGDAEEARDAAQDAFVKAYFNLARFRAGAPFRPWIVRIAANEARNRRMAAARRQGLVQRAAVAGGLSAAGEGGALDEARTHRAAGASVGDGAGSPEAMVLAQERREAIVSALNELRHEDRVAIASRYFLELSEAEMAATLGWARGTVKSRLSRALGRLRHRLVAAAVLAVVLLLALLAVPQTRAAIAERLGVLGIRIVGMPFLPQEPAALAPRGALSEPAAPSEGAAALADRLRLGQPVTLQEAQRRVAYRVLLPSDPALGAPDEVFHSAAVAGGQVSFVYHARAGAPPASQTGVALLVSQFRGALEPELYAKMLGPHTHLERLTLDGGRAVWLEGAPHAVIVRTPEGQIFVDQARLAANVLAWERGGLTLRLEGALDRPTALRLATSFR